MSPRRALLTASTGGHLEQITRLAPRFSPAFDGLAFATFDDPQSRSLLAEHTTHYVHKIPPRGLRQAMDALGPAMRIIRQGRFTDVISTGSAIAVPFLTAARLLGVRAHYIESAARAEGPSMSGKLVSRIPGVHLYAQYPSWAQGRWAYRGSVIDRFRVAEATREVGSVRRAVVTFGTMRGYPFDRGVLAAQRILSEIGAQDREVLWQVGDSEVPVTHGDARDMVPAAELHDAIDEADLVIAHSGVGSSMRILESGRAPLLLSRLARHLEHIDDHQLMIAGELERRGLAVSRDPDEATAQDALDVLGRVIETRTDLAPFELDTARRRPVSPAELPTEI